MTYKKDTHLDRDIYTNDTKLMAYKKDTHLDRGHALHGVLRLAELDHEHSAGARRSPKNLHTKVS